MLNVIVLVFIGLIGGVAAAIQAPLTGLMGQRLGDLESVFITYVGGGVLIALIVLVCMSGGNLHAWHTLPWYVFCAGPLGLVIIGSISYAVPRLGAAPSATLLIAAHLILSSVIDHYGLFGVPQRSLDTSRLIGLVTLLVGTWLMVRNA